MMKKRKYNTLAVAVTCPASPSAMAQLNPTAVPRAAAKKRAESKMTTLKAKFVEHVMSMWQQRHGQIPNGAFMRWCSPA